ncbi:MAG TPA: DUF5666 domain-containing protein [Thermoanaerobaculia bacterium]
MSRKLIVLTLLVLLSLSAFAADRTLAKRDLLPRGGTVNGIVESVDGNFIKLAGGLVVVDASEAQVVVDRGREGSVAQIEPGMLLFATIARENPPSSHPVQKASMISATHFRDATLTGTVQSVSTDPGALTLLGQTVYVDDDTSFGGFRRGEDFGLADILPNQIVQVQVDAVNGRLIAREVLVLSPVLPQVGRLRGEVKSIGTDSWDVETETETVTIAVNAQTKIIGSPKAGDTVEVLYNVNSANQKVAISIIRFEPAPPAPKVVQFHGTVKSITGSTWVVTEDATHERTFTVNERTKVLGNPRVGDLVHVFAHETEGGVLNAITVMRLRL